MIGICSHRDRTIPLESAGHPGAAVAERVAAAFRPSAATSRPCVGRGSGDREDRPLTRCVADMYVCHMKRTTVYLDEASYERLKRLARRRGCAPAVLVREAVAEYGARHASRRLPESLGAFRSGRRDLGERAEDLLKGFGRSR